MTTGYTPILKLALPVTGELNGTWGTVVNDNITSMVEQSVAGLATINTWTTNSHTLTSADGTTSESRCAMLVIDDDGAGNPSAAATVICPTATKSYIVRNICGQTVTVKTLAGTGVAVPNNQAALVFCDGTNVVTGAFNGDVVGPATATNNAIVTFDGTTGKIIKDNSGATISAGVITATGFAGPLNGTVGATTPATGAFTTLSASSTVSGTGFSTYLASPPAIGGTTAAAGSFTNLSVTGTTSFDSSEGTSGQVLTSAGTGNTPTWTTPTVGTVTSVGGTGTVNGLSLSGTVTTSGNLTLGGTLDLTSPPAIGGTTAAAGSFTNLAYTGTLTGGTGVVNIGSNQIYKDASGRIGVGVVPRTDWVAGSTVVQFPSNHSIVQNSTLLYTFSNLYLGTDGNYRYTGSSVGGYFYSAAGNFAFARSLYTPTPDAIAVTTNMLSMSPSTGIVDIGSAAMGSATFSFSMAPLTDNATSCGTASKRWTIVYATTGTINTSDARQKTPVRSLNDLEIAAAQELASEIGAFQWLEAVEKKGSAARWHVGVTVQRVMQIMEKHSLDPFAYGLVCFDAWEDIINEDGVKTQEKGDAFSLRPDQLSLFIAKGQQVTMQNLASQLEEVKAQLAALKA